MQEEAVEISAESQEDQIKRWKGRIELARRYRDQHGNTGDRWTTNIKALAGDFNSLAELGDESIDVNMVRSTSKTTLPPLFTLDPHISVRPTKDRASVNGVDFDNVRAAEHAELEINYWLRELKVRHQVRKMILDGEATNHGYLMTGWADAKRAATDNHPTVKSGQPYARRHPPKDVLVPPGFWDLEDCPWVDIIFRRTVAQTKRLYPKAEEIVPTIEATSDSEEKTSDFAEFLGTDDAKLVEIHVIYNTEDKKVYVLAEGNDGYLEDPKGWPDDLEGFPLTHYRPEEIPDEYWGTPPITYSLPQNKERNATRTAMRKKRNRTKSVIWMDSEIAEEAKEQYAAAQDGEIIPLNLGGEPITSKIIVDTGLPFDSGDIAYDRVISDDYRVITGQSAEQGGAGDPNVDSATASANIEKNVQVRQSERGDRVRDVYIDVAKKLVMLLRKHPNVERTRRIAGPEAGRFTEIKYTLRDLHGEFDFDLDFSAMLSDNPLTRITQAITNYNLLRPDPLVESGQLLLDIFASQNKVAPAAYLLKLKSPDEELQLMGQLLPVEAHDRDPHEQHMPEHERQAQEIDAVIARASAKDPQFAESPEGVKLRAVVVLLTAHAQDHARRMQALVGQSGGSPSPGQPIAENQFRNQVRTTPGGETEAEMSGQPLAPTGTIQ